MTLHLHLQPSEIDNFYPYEFTNWKKLLAKYLKDKGEAEEKANKMHTNQANNMKRVPKYKPPRPKR